MVILEWLAVGCNLVFIGLLIKQKRMAWWFGIVGSLLSIFLFISAKLYAEAILYLFYVVMGFYGLYNWRKSAIDLPINEVSLTKHLQFILLSMACSIGLGAFFATQTDAQKPYADALSTVFGFLATYLEAKKVLSTWLYWIVLNGFSVWLYFSRTLYVYAGLMVLYTVLSVVGYLQWQKSYKTQSTG